MWMSGREVARALGARPGLSRSQVQTLLAVGLAGAPIKAAGAHLYDSDVVDELAGRPAMTDGEIEALCPRGPFIARIGPDRGFHLAATERDQAASLEEWYTSLLTQVWMSIDRPVRFPFVATAADYVVWGADIVGWRAGRARTDERDPRPQLTRLTFGPAGDWFTGFAGRRICRGPGYPYLIHGAPAAGPAWRPWGTLERPA